VLESAPQPVVKADVLPTSAAQAVETQQDSEDAFPPRIRQPTLPEECGTQGEWVQAAETIVDAHNTFHRMDGVCFDYRRRRTYALNEQALESLPPSARRDAPFPFAGVLSKALQNRTHTVRGATLFLKTQHEGMHGRSVSNRSIFSCSITSKPPAKSHIVGYPGKRMAEMTHHSHAVCCLCSGGTTCWTGPTRSSHWPPPVSQPTPLRPPNPGHPGPRRCVAWTACSCMTCPSRTSTTRTPAGCASCSRGF
jgi:hypothetical protein